MKRFAPAVSFLLAFVWASQLSAQNNSHNPTWWNKYQYLLNHAADDPTGPNSSINVGANVDVSNECGPQSETYIAINPSNPKILAAGSNEIFRDPMRGYFSSNGGSSWGGVDLPLPAAIGNGIRFGSDPSVAFDTRGNVFYGYIVVFFGNGNGVNGTEMAVAKSSDGGKTYPAVTFFDFSGGSDHFNDKPIITADTNSGSPFRDNVYIAWDTSGGSTSSGGVRVATSSDHGATFNSVRIDAPGGQANSIGASPFVGPDGTLYVAWNDFGANTIAFARSSDGGATWQRPNIVSTKTALFDLGIPAEEFRRALVYPSCDSDRSAGPHRGRIYCSWMDLTASGANSDILLAFSDDKGSTWSRPAPVTDQLSFPVDRFNQWMAVDPVTGDVNVSFYDTRNDSTGFRFMTDTFFSQSTNGGQSFAPNVRVSTVSSNEHDCNGIFPCNAIDYGNQQGDYEGLASFGGVSHPIWTDSRLQQAPATGCRRGLAMEEVFTAVVK